MRAISICMERWQDQGIVLSVRRHGENGGIVSLLTQNLGRHAGYVRGVTSSKMRGVLEGGNQVDASWQSRADNELGTYTLELRRTPAAPILGDGLRLAALQSACALCDAALPEREGHPGLYHGFLAMAEALASDIWAQAYVMWEIALLRELGFSLDLTKCAGGGDAWDLAYVSPKTGRAVSRAAGAIYKEKLLALPQFLAPSKTPFLQSEDEHSDIINGLKLTGFFLEKWAFAHHSAGVPESRLVLSSRLLARAA